jgi:hypothetical protein
MPNPNVPNAVWEIAETEEMKEVIGLYGKTYHFWQVDRGDTLPLGKPELMMSFTKDDQVINHYCSKQWAHLLTILRYHGRKSRTEMSGTGLRRVERRK